MWASSKIYERIHFPTDLYEIHLLDWLMPLDKNESLDSYCLRFSEFITEPNPIFIGVSFGGIIAQELSKKFKNTKVIIISSIKHHKEKPPLYRFLHKTRLYHLFPISLINFLEPKAYKLAKPSLKRTLVSYRKHLPIRNVNYTKWALHAFFNWKQKEAPLLLHIHGDNDTILPLKHIKNPQIISKGTHNIILTKSSTIQAEILRFLG